jgi:hypothetical protein
VARPPAQRRHGRTWIVPLAVAVRALPAALPLLHRLHRCHHNASAHMRMHTRAHMHRLHPPVEYAARHPPHRHPHTDNRTNTTP